MEIYRRYGPALLRKARRILSCEADAQDVVQGLFVDLLRKRRTDVSLPYLYRAVTHRCLNLIRDRDTQARLRSEHGIALAGAGARAGADASIEGLTIDRDLLRKLARRLGKGRTEVLVYRYLDGMGLAEIADLMRKNPKTIARWLTTGRALALTMASEGSHG